jgi:hypothetical protein
MFLSAAAAAAADDAADDENDKDDDVTTARAVDGRALRSEAATWVANIVLVGFSFTERRRKEVPNTHTGG